MTKKEITRMAAAIRKVADSGEVNRLTLNAIVQALDVALCEMGHAKHSAGFTHNATGRIDLSGTDWLARIGAK